MAITGAGSGLGKELAYYYGSIGHTVILMGRNRNTLDAVRETILDSSPQSRSQIVDVRDYESFKESVDLIFEIEGRLDLFFNNAAVTAICEFLEMPLDFIDNLIQTNLLGVTYGSQLVYQKLIIQGFGHIINVGSIAGISGYPSSAVYSGSKSGVYKFSQSLFEEAKIHNINISVVHCSYLKTDLFRKGFLGSFPEKDLINSFPFRLSSASNAAKVIADGVKKKKFDIFFPIEAKLINLISRFFPSIIEMMTKKLYRRHLNLTRN